jgi:hypothetical protein
MFAPGIDARVKEWRERAAYGVEAGDIGSFVQIAVQTSQCQIAGDCVTAVFHGDDMIDVEYGPVEFR